MDRKLYEIIGQLYATHYYNLENMSEMNKAIEDLQKQIKKLEQKEGKQGVKINSSINTPSYSDKNWEDESLVESNSELSEVNG